MGGRRRPNRGVIEDTFKVNANALHRSGLLLPGKAGRWCSTVNEKEGTKVDFHVTDDDHLVLEYEARLSPDSPFVTRTDRVRIDRVKCAFGGVRPILVCPVSGCTHRATNLYLSGVYFKCWRCADLVYACQREDADTLALRLAQKVRLQMGAHPSVFYEFPDRPKSMRHAIYAALKKHDDETFISASLFPVVDSILCETTHTYRVEPLAKTSGAMNL